MGYRIVELAVLAKVRVFFLVFLMYGLISYPAEAVTVTGIHVEGNQRIEQDSILYHASIKLGDDLTQAQLNNALKALFDTNLFSNVNIDHKAGVVTITVAENPIINRVLYEGNRRVNDETLNGEVSVKPRDVYTKSRVQADTLRVQSIYRRQGRFAAIVVPKLIKLPQNRVDLIFEINEGPLTGIKKILFVGNKKFSPSKLKSVLRTKETRWYRFLTTDDNYDAERVSYDRELLRVFYLENGHVDFKVLSAVAELLMDKSGFFITFTIEEGARYKVGKLDIVNRISEVDPKILKEKLLLASGDWYNGAFMEKSIDAMTDALGDHGYAFVSIEPHFKKNPETKTIDIELEIKESSRVYVGQVNIGGNLATYDKVIRREFRLAEGDAFNISKLRRSEQRLRNLDFFSSVNVEKEQGEAPDKVDLKVSVKEKSTGEISLAGGVSSLEGPLANVRYAERNFRGRGQEISSDLTVSKKTREFDVSFTEPYFLDKNLAAGVDLFRTRQDQTHQSGYMLNRQGFSVRTSYHLTEFLTQRVWYTLRKDHVGGVKPDASAAIQQQVGSRLTSSVAQDLIYDQRDNRVDPTQGYVLELKNEYAGVGGDSHFFSHTVKGSKYFPVTEGVVFSLRATGNMVSLIKNHKVMIVDRLFLGGDALRGFEYYGISPRDKDKGEGLGGRYAYAGSAELGFPIGLPNELGIKGHTFLDAGSVWHSDQPAGDVNDSPSLRMATGMGISWSSPIGPIRLDISKPLRYKSFDRRQVVLFSFRTTF